MSSPKPTSTDKPEAKTPEEDIIKVKTLISSTSGDLRRTSFIVTAVQRALAKFGVTSRSVFQGEWVLKKIGGDFSQKLRCVWIDPTDYTFHWSKVGDRTEDHKRIRLQNRLTKVSKDKNFFTQTNEFSITVQFYNGEKLHMKWQPNIGDDTTDTGTIPAKLDTTGQGVSSASTRGDGSPSAGDMVSAPKKFGSGATLAAMLDPSARRSTSPKPDNTTSEGNSGISSSSSSSAAAAVSNTYVLSAPVLDVHEVEHRMNDWVKVFQAIIDQGDNLVVPGGSVKK